MSAASPSPAAASTAFIGLGGNVGDVAATLRAAVEAIDALPSTRVLRRSPLYCTPAWGRRDQADFVNAALAVETGLAPRALLEALLAIEQRFGRDRDADAARWGPRTLDLDLLLHGDHLVDEPGLHLPHPHLHARAFVLVPLADIAPGLVVPGQGTVDALLATVARDGIEALP